MFSHHHANRIPNVPFHHANFQRGTEELGLQNFNTRQERILLPGTGITYSLQGRIHDPFAEIIILQHRGRHGMLSHASEKKQTMHAIEKNGKLVCGIHGMWVVHACCIECSVYQHFAHAVCGMSILWFEDTAQMELHSEPVLSLCTCHTKNFEGCQCLASGVWHMQLHRCC